MTAEQGIVGLALYIALLAAALARLLAGARGDPYRAFVAAGFVAVVVHTWLYAAFLEDPVTWALLAVGDVAGGEPARQRCTRYPCCRPGGIRLIVASSPVQGKPARSATMREGTLSWWGRMSSVVSPSSQTAQSRSSAIARTVTPRPRAGAAVQ